MRFHVREVAEALGVPAPGGGTVTGWSVDTRTLNSGDLFFALRGPSHDGHAYLRQAFEKGAAAAVVERAEPAVPGPLLIVPDSQRALEQLGAWARRKWGRDVIAVTGSAGKTTTKDVVARMLAVRFRTGKTVGNFNNHVGVPLSILRLDEASELAVLEMGMNHAGEIAHLAAIAGPRVGVVTNVGYAHVENFDSIDGVAAAKRELVEALPPDGVAVLNADDERVARFASHVRCRVLTYGTAAGAEIRAEEIQSSDRGVTFRVGGVMFESRLSGRHGVSNLLAGVAVCSIYGIDPSQLREAAAEIEPGPMRGAKIVKDGVVHFNDCYNSNPDAARSMIDLLAGAPATRRIAVLGEMLELGRWAEPLHRDLGRYAAQAGIDILIGVRGAGRHIVEGAREAGLGAGCFFEEPEAAGRHVRGIVREGDAILWKGSRGTRVERALEEFFK